MLARGKGVIPRRSYSLLSKKPSLPARQLCVMLEWPMKKHPLITKLHKPVHPTLGNIVLIGAVILVIVAVIELFLPHSSSPAPATISQNLPTPTPTSILAQSPNTTPTLLSTNGWKTYQ